MRFKKKMDHFKNLCENNIKILLKKIPVYLSNICAYFGVKSYIIQYDMGRFVCTCMHVRVYVCKGIMYVCMSHLTASSFAVGT